MSNIRKFKLVDKQAYVRSHHSPEKAARHLVHCLDSDDTFRGEVSDQGKLERHSIYGTVVLIEPEDFHHFIEVPTLQQKVERVENYPCCMSCYATIDEMKAAKAMKDAILKILKEKQYV